MAAISSSPVVQAIDQKSIHQICSGQVVLSIATAMKELVENSLDAGATNIEIKLRNHGADVLEVIDNGCGVEPHNFEALTLKHHTSKLKDFSDLASVETFGFRGEALSSLCALSKLTIVTHHSSQTVATRLEYDHNGKLLSKNPCARDVGTTVLLENIFSTLPVRHREFLRNIKREFSKLAHVLQGYCLVSTGVRIMCSNQVEKGKKTTTVSTNGSDQVKDNITCVFGPKQVQTIMAFEQSVPNEEDCTEVGLDVVKTDPQNSPFHITGYISKPDHGMGRSSADRQFLYINKRPCELSKVVRVINEVYHTYNRHQYPFVMLDISLARDGVDVNVTPDKRQVFVQEEKVLLATMKSSLKRMFDPCTASFDVNQKPLKQIKLSETFAAKEGNGVNFPEKEELQNQKALNSTVNEVVEVSRSVQPTLTARPGVSEERGGFPSLSGFKRKFTVVDEYVTKKPKEPSSKQARLTSMFSRVGGLSNQSHKVRPRSERKQTTVINGQGDNEELMEDCRISEDVIEVQHKLDSKNFVDEEYVLDHNGEDRSVQSESDSILRVISSRSEVRDILNGETVLDDNTVEESSSRCPASFQSLSFASESGENNQDDPEPQTENQFPKENVDSGDYAMKVITLTPNRPKALSSKQGEVSGSFTDRKESTVNFSMDDLLSNAKKPQRRKAREVEARLFRAKIAPESNSSAETELRKNISKDMFKRMEILGQFNLGFIVAKLDNDLFIIDQHASDEKYNFEDQQRNTIIRSQRLIVPQKLELTASNEAILMDNVEIFRKNGFEFEIDENAEAMRKVKLISLPMSKNWTFGVEDIEELIFMLSDSPGVMCRPSRVRKMFASRACRMSIMVGTALDQAQMKKIVRHMGEIQHPWNCPHGRPTMRHLVNLGMLPSSDFL
ncbi:mismatch repair endonuclease PMS2-like [Stylophora pistillata]|uniref:Mismatch repair endonuclease PMS2 n=1 Tax=Stylophora pistillata TaxID=50429 RepID=A0A2B4SH66_STYPI|nr:mismatch repair endonuclease PMS2-like [Stylophora pistillata]PFX27938.1 Mismatch repair endonuclease PMS2 [Stylophora pistillata]